MPYYLLYLLFKIKIFKFSSLQGRTHCSIKNLMTWLNETSLYWNILLVLMPYYLLYLLFKIKIFKFSSLQGRTHCSIKNLMTWLNETSLYWNRVFSQMCYLSIMEVSLLVCLSCWNLPNYHAPIAHLVLLENLWWIEVHWDGFVTCRLTMQELLHDMLCRECWTCTRTIAMGYCGHMGG